MIAIVYNNQILQCYAPECSYTSTTITVRSIILYITMAYGKSVPCRSFIIMVVLGVCQCIAVIRISVLVCSSSPAPIIITLNVPCGQALIWLIQCIMALCSRKIFKPIVS